MAVEDNIISLEALTAVSDDIRKRLEAEGLIPLKDYRKYPGVITSGSDPVWDYLNQAASTYNSYRHILVPIHPGDVFKIINGNVDTFKWAVLKAYNPAAGRPSAAGDMATGYETRQLIQKNGSTDDLTAPEDAAYLILFVYWGKDVYPTSLLINGREYMTDARELAETVDTKLEEMRVEHGAALDDLQDQIDQAGLVSRGAPEEAITWQVGSLNNNGGYYSNKNAIRTNTAFFAPMGSTISCAEGYRIRVYEYSSDSDITSFTGKTDWVTSYTADEDHYLRILVSDPASIADSSVVLPDTSYQEQVIWGLVVSTIREDMEAIQQAVPGKTEGAWLDITWELVPDGWIYKVNVGQTISYTPSAENLNYRHMIRNVKAGDQYRISGSGGSEARLWIFADSEDKVITYSNTYVNAEGLVITAPADGRLVINCILGTGKVTPKIEAWLGRADLMEEEDEKRAERMLKAGGLDILAAFNNITCCGDSLTTSVVYTGETGTGYITRAAHRRWTEILASRTGATVTYIATGGFDPIQWWDTYSGRIEAKDNQLAIINLGTNNGLTDTLDDESTEAGAYCKIVQAFLNVGAKVLLVHVKKTSTSIWTTNAVIDKIAEQYGVAVVDVPLLRDRKYHSYPDGTGQNNIHYNDLGYSAYAELLMRCVGELEEKYMLRLIPT